MKAVIGAVAIAALVLTPALAADMAVKAPSLAAAPQPFDWSGFYVGVNAGGHWSIDNDPAFISFNNNAIPGNVVLLNQLAPVTLKPSGFAGGVHVGYNWQMTNWVYGVEADIDGLSNSASRNLNTPIIVDTAQFMDSAQDRWMSTVRMRFGWAADHWLFFVTGGVAFSDWELDHTYTINGGGPGQPTGITNGHFLRTGGTAGGGIEYALNQNLLIRAEYLWAGFGTATQVVNAATGAFNTAYTLPQRLSENIARAGITYKFDPR